MKLVGEARFYERGWRYGCEKSVDPPLDGVVALGEGPAPEAARGADVCGHRFEYGTCMHACMHGPHGSHEDGVAKRDEGKGKGVPRVDMLYGRSTHARPKVSLNACMHACVQCGQGGH